MSPWLVEYASEPRTTGAFQALALARPVPASHQLERGGRRRRWPASSVAVGRRSVHHLYPVAQHEDVPVGVSEFNLHVGQLLENLLNGG
jgi:hypothetical protein